MDKLVSIAIFIVAAIPVQMFLPWWSLPIWAAFYGFFATHKPATCFLMGFIGASLLWGSLSLFFNIQNNGILAGRMGDLLNVKPFVLIIISAVIAGLLSGFGMMTGRLARTAKS
jgi:hypothetical protein